MAHRAPKPAAMNSSRRSRFGLLREIAAFRSQVDKGKRKRIFSDRRPATRKAVMAHRAPKPAAIDSPCTRAPFFEKHFPLVIEHGDIPFHLADHRAMKGQSGADKMKVFLRMIRPERILFGRALLQ